MDVPLVRVRRHPLNASRDAKKMLERQKAVLSQYSPDQIRAAIERRHLPWEENQTDIASVYYGLEKWDEGFLICQEIIRNCPRFADGYFGAALYYYEKGELNQAAGAFRQTLQLAPAHEAALNNLAAVLAIQGDLLEAKKLLRKALQNKRHYLDARHNLLIIETKGCLNLREARITRRKLRPVITYYQF